jgi:hypothetical protein
MQIERPGWDPASFSQHPVVLKIFRFFGKFCPEFVKTDSSHPFISIISLEHTWLWRKDCCCEDGVILNFLLGFGEIALILWSNALCSVLALPSQLS